MTFQHRELFEILISKVILIHNLKNNQIGWEMD